MSTEHEPLRAVAYMLNIARHRSKTEIMLYGWLDLRPLGHDEYLYWQNHALPSGHSILSEDLENP